MSGLQRSPMGEAALQIGALAALLVIAVVRWSGPDASDGSVETSGDFTPSGLLAGEDTAGFDRADVVRPFVFPDDHGAHPGFRTEWWYFTGNLATNDDAKRHFGFQLTFFRFALTPDAVPGPSSWRSGQSWMAHFAVTDSAGGELYSSERFSRGALDLAGAVAAPFRVWLSGWEAVSVGEPFLPLQLKADAGDFAITLDLTEGKPKVLQGEAGLSPKSAEPGNASYYYSYTRLPTAGEVRIGETSFRVTGNAWMDREWSTSALGPGTEGWDWFALQFDDGSDLMYYRLRGEDGSTGPQSGGVLVAADGSTTKLSAGDVELTVERRWTSPRTGIDYPVAWRLVAPAHDLALVVTPRIDDQELNLSVVYWEGAVKAEGRRGGQRVWGTGYLELAGYAR